MRTSIIGYPRIGSNRQLKFALEDYFKNRISFKQLENCAAILRQDHWEKQKSAGINFIPSNDFSFYDNVLDTAFLLNIIPSRYENLKLDTQDIYFAMARGYQGKEGDVKALALKKWFNTNYHYIVPEIEDDTAIKLVGNKPFDEFIEAEAKGITTKPVIIGAFTLLKLIKFNDNKTIKDVTQDIINAYISILDRFDHIGAEWIQFDEPSLVTDLSNQDVDLFNELYNQILSNKKSVKVLLQTYFGDIRDCYNNVVSKPFDGIGLDFFEGKKSLELIKEKGFPKDKLLFAGVVNGKNIWKNNYKQTIDTIFELEKHTNELIIGTSCSLLHVPYTLQNETDLEAKYKERLAFAQEKIFELLDMKDILSSSKPTKHPKYIENYKLLSTTRANSIDKHVQEKITKLCKKDFERLPDFSERKLIQQKELNLPLFPTTTIGSFPQTPEIRSQRAVFKKGKISSDQYEAFIKNQIDDCLSLQEAIGLDVLVHGEFERSDMVEYFGENLYGYIFTKSAWVQSYGTRCVKPPIIWGDVKRSAPITIFYSVYAQKQTQRPVKGMLTGPITILNWSFPREDISLKESALQIALAIREEVLDLESNGIRIIQIDEAALREKLPLRKSDWNSEYLDWTIPAFRLTHSAVSAKTQIHTHMCYSEFDDIICEIDDMDADVISFEASRSDLTILQSIKDNDFKTDIGPGIYDIHSPRIPSVDELKNVLTNILETIPTDKLWVNPDCGLKTRGKEETIPSLKNLVIAAQTIRRELTDENN